MALDRARPGGDTLFARGGDHPRQRGGCASHGLPHWRNGCAHLVRRCAARRAIERVDAQVERGPAVTDIWVDGQGRMTGALLPSDLANVACRPREPYPAE